MAPFFVCIVCANYFKKTKNVSARHVVFFILLVTIKLLLLFCTTLFPIIQVCISSLVVWMTYCVYFFFVSRYLTLFEGCKSVPDVNGAFLHDSSVWSSFSLMCSLKLKVPTILATILAHISVKKSKYQ